MPVLNKPFGDDETDPRDDWTPARGLWAGALRGGAVAVVLSLALAPLAGSLPYLLLPCVLRTAWAFGLMWVLLYSVRSAAGMTGPGVAAIACGWTTFVLLSHHFVFAVHGVISAGGLADDFSGWWIWPAQLLDSVIGAANGQLRGWGWFHPLAVLAATGPPVALGAGACLAIHRYD